LYKKGDALDTDNFRGLSMIETPAKLFLTLMGSRIRKALDDEEILSRSQAGFRPREECIAQGVTLREICLRRKLDGKKTYILFIDFKKAYDSVSQALLTLKMRSKGVRGRMLKFFKNLYKNSMVEVRAPTEVDAPMFNLFKGVRQGCPTSTDAYSIFQDDLFDDSFLGVTVPHAGGRESTIAGLLFADDGAGFAADLTSFAHNISRIEKWATANKMAFGHGPGKSGMMVVSDDPNDTVALENAHLTLHGEPIAIVSSYKYLGLEHDKDLSLDHMVQGRIKKGHAARVALQPLLTDVRVPVAVKRDVMLSKLQPVLTYGGEVLGMENTTRRDLTLGLQNIMNMCLRSVAMGHQSAPDPSKAALMAELGLPPVASCMHGLRARAFLKFPSLRTYVTNFMSDAKYSPETGGDLRPWFPTTRDWLENKGFDVDAVNACLQTVSDDPSKVPGASLVRARPGKRKRMRSYDDLSEVPSSLFGRFVKWKCAWQELAKCKDKSYIAYRDAGFVLTRGYLTPVQGMSSTLASLGLQAVLQARTGCFQTTNRLATRTLVASRFLTVCPFCSSTQGGEGETLTHILLHCGRWAAERKSHLQNLLDQGVELVPGSSDDELRTLILGGTVAGKSFGNVWAYGHRVPGTRTTSIFPPLCWGVARFFCAISGPRNRRLQELHAANAIKLDILCVDIEMPETPGGGLDPLLLGAPTTPSTADVDILLSQEDDEGDPLLS
jgi:sorting nexin-29